MVFMMHRTIFTSWAVTLYIKCQFTEVQEQFFFGGDEEMLVQMKPGFIRERGSMRVIFSFVQ
jgi:hypothetical protein